MSDIIASDVQGHYIDSALISLFEIEVQGTYVFFHSGLDETLEEVQFVSRDTTRRNFRRGTVRIARYDHY